MRSLLVLCVLAACDPVWHVDNVATAKQPAYPNEQCVEEAIRATGLEFSDVSGHVTNRPAREWRVNGTRVEWDPEKAHTIKLGVAGVGTEPPAGAVERYRTTRATLVNRLQATCRGTFEVSVEQCDRVKDCGAR